MLGLASDRHIKIELEVNFLFFFLTGYSLICHRCNSLTGSCALNTTTECNTTLHQTCRSISVNEFTGLSRVNYLLSDCGNCFGLITFNTGRLSRYVQTSCCSSDLCNDDVEPEIETSRLNNLECHGCIAVNGTCTNGLAPVKCKGQQDHCVHTSGILQGVRPLICNQCTGLSGSCSFTPVTCRSGTTTCRTTSTTTISEERTTKQITNACGPCSAPISFNFGRLVISKSSSCCASDRCNQQIDTEPVNNTLTGLKCQGCFGRSFNSCRDSEKAVNCVGAENRCVNTSGIEAVLSFGERFFAKGCVSEQVCQLPDSMEGESIRFDGQPACCTGNFCNGDLQGGTSTAEPGVITSSPVMSETTGKEPTNSNAVITSSPVMSETTGKEPTNSNAVITSSPVMSETTGKEPTNSNAVITSSPVMSETTGKEPTNSNAVITSSPVMSETTGKEPTNSNAVITSSPVMSETTGKEPTNSNGVITSSPVMSETTGKEPTNSNEIIIPCVVVLGLIGCLVIGLIIRFTCCRRKRESGVV
ncbi:uncharacterized protein LOC144508730 [Mustelus asterias]